MDSHTSTSVEADVSEQHLEAVHAGLGEQATSFTAPTMNLGTPRWSKLNDGTVHFEYPSATLSGKAYAMTVAVTKWSFTSTAPADGAAGNEDAAMTSATWTLADD